MLNMNTSPTITTNSSYNQAQTPNNSNSLDDSGTSTQKHPISPLGKAIFNGAVDGPRIKITNRGQGCLINEVHKK